MLIKQIMVVDKMNLEIDQFEIEKMAHIKRISKEDLAKMIDHTNLKPYATSRDIEKLCNEAKQYGFGAICISPTWVSYAKKLLSGTDIKIATVIGFPLGSTSTKAKVEETKKAVEDGADELDMVINIGALKEGNLDLVKRDIQKVVEASNGKVVKVIIETGYLTYEEKITSCKLAKEAGADFVKTATGFGPMGATAVDVWIMRKTVGEDMGVKAAGGVSSYEAAIRVIAAGANRIGTSSGVKIMKTYEEAQKNNFEFKYEIPCNICPASKISQKTPQDVREYYEKKCRACRYYKYKELLERC